MDSETIAHLGWVIESLNGPDFEGDGPVAALRSLLVACKAGDREAVFEAGELAWERLHIGRNEVLF